MNTLLCLCFIQSFAGQNAHIPEQVDQLVKSRIVQQIKARRPEIESTFEKSNCQNQSNYYYTSDSLVLEGHNELWDGKMETSITDIIDGKSLDFHPLKTIPSATAQVAEIPSSNVSSSKSSYKKWLPLIAVTAGVIVGAFIVNRNSSSDQSSSSPPPAAEPSSPSKLKHWQ